MVSLDTLINNNNSEEWKALWDTTIAASEEKQPLPSGLYEAEAIKGEQFKSKSGTAGYKITYQITEGEHTGRLVWQDLWLTKAAIPFTKRTLGKLGLPSPDSPFPKGLVCAIEVCLRQTDNGYQFNEVRKVELIRQEVNPFAPKAEETKVESQPAKNEAAKDESQAVEQPLPEAGWTIPSYVKLVADAIPVGRPVCLGDINTRTNLDWITIGKAIEALKPFGLRVEFWKASYLYLWDKRPNLVAEEVANA